MELDFEIKNGTDYTPSIVQCTVYNFRITMQFLIIIIIFSFFFFWNLTQATSLKYFIRRNWNFKF